MAGQSSAADAAANDPFGHAGGKSGVIATTGEDGGGGKEACGALMQEVTDIVGDGNDSGQGGATASDVDRGVVGIDAPSEGAGFPDLEAAIVKEAEQERLAQGVDGANVECRDSTPMAPPLWRLSSMSCQNVCSFRNSV